MSFIPKRQYVEQSRGTGDFLTPFTPLGAMGLI